MRFRPSLLWGMYNLCGNVSKSALVKSKPCFGHWPQACQYSGDNFNEWMEEDDNNVMEDNNYQEFSDHMFRIPGQGHKVLVIQPFYRSTEDRNNNTTPELQLEESVALIKSLPGWSVIDTALVPLHNFKKRDLFGSGNMEKLKQKVKGSREISAVFVSLNILRVRQLIELEQVFDISVYDRYSIVIQIFRNHAVTQEAKLQVAMAEIPYLKQCVKGLSKGFSDRLGRANLVGGSGLTFQETRRLMLSSREQKLKTALHRLRHHRERLRIKRSKVGFPVVAVVGYTNAGKTSLIKCVTGEAKLQPRNQLFATLDVTKHAGTLPCHLEVLYVDTVGFITDIPTSLIESFTATLEDAILSDLIIHVWDVSNPDSCKQREHVWHTLKGLKLSEDLLGKVFEVGNKVDKLSEGKFLELQKAEPHMSFVSAKTGFGISDFLKNLQKKVLEATSRFRMVIRVRTGGEEFTWLQQEVPVETFQVDSEDSQYCLMGVVITDAKLQVFKHKFL